MNQIFLSKVQHVLEAIFLFLTISWQPLFGIIASACAALYYAEMLKINVVNKDHGGSWSKYFKSFIKKR